MLALTPDRRALAGVLFLPLLACGSETEPSPADTGGSQLVDAGASSGADLGTDASVDLGVDAGALPSDAGPTSDAGPNDAGATDLGPGDAGPAPALFPAGAWFNQPIDTAPLHPRSAEMTQWLADNGGWGFGRMQIDFSLTVMEAEADTPYETFEPTRAFYETDCDAVPFPVPANGRIEGESGMACEGDGDCHLIVIDRRVDRLFEMWRANITPEQFFGGCVAAWDLTRVYGPEGRGEQCTSADAAGFPIAPLLFSADEIAAGEIRHAIRFTLPNPRMRARSYVRPATHAGNPSGPESAPIYGSRWRLRADYPVDSLENEGARVVARAMQRYGMALADGGNIALTARNDFNTTAKWADIMGPHALRPLQPTDFEIIDTGEIIPLTYECVRTPY